MNPSESKNSVIFQIGEIFKSENFKETVWLNMLTPFGSALPVANVTFETGCRNSWHKHAGGQVLLVTGGRGWHQEWGKPTWNFILKKAQLLSWNRFRAKITSY